MSRTRKPWTKAKIRRVCESIWAGGYLAERTTKGCLLRLSYPRSGLVASSYLIPPSSLPDHQGQWLGRRFIGVMRHWLAALDGTRRLGGAEARDLTRWLTRRGRPKYSSPAEAAAVKRKAKRIQFAEMIHCGGYTAERTRKGWIVRLNSRAGRLRGQYLVPFRALDSRNRDWNDRVLMLAMKQSVRGIQSALRINRVEALS